jgi:negative modulator of initiation of replication
LVAPQPHFVAANSPHVGNRFNFTAVKKIEISDEVYAALQELATGFNRTPNDVLASLLNIPTTSAEAAEPLAAFILSAEFRTKTTDADKYLGLLGWISRKHEAEFGEFIRAQSSGRRFLGLSREEIVEACRHNQARQIEGTQYWAIMNLDTATKRRFLARVLEFIGYREAVIEFACGVIGLRSVARRGRLVALVA